MYKATLYNANCDFDSVKLSNVNDIKDWAKGGPRIYELIELQTDRVPLP